MTRWNSKLPFSFTGEKASGGRRFRNAAVVLPVAETVEAEGMAMDVLVRLLTGFALANEVEGCVCISTMMRANILSKGLDLGQGS